MDGTLLMEADARLRGRISCSLDSIYLWSINLAGRLITSGPDHRIPSQTMAAPLFQTLTAPNGRSIEQPLGLFINNEWRAAKSGDSITVISPMWAPTQARLCDQSNLLTPKTLDRNEQEIAKVHAAGEQDVDDAVKAAREAFKGPWSKISGTERGELMRKLADLAEELIETFATIDTWNNGP
jgi:aldehyde dehydrogenase (NAD+)